MDVNDVNYLGLAQMASAVDKKTAELAWLLIYVLTLTNTESVVFVVFVCCFICIAI